jgi:hypothetical protein
MITRLSKVGLIVGGVYTAYFALLMGLDYSASDKASALLGQFAVIPAGLFLSVLGSFLGYRDFPIPPDSWMNSYYLYYPMSLVISYLFGWGSSAVGGLLIRLDGGRLNRLDERILDHFDKET